MTPQLYHERYQVWDRDGELVPRSAAAAPENRPRPHAAVSAELTPARLRPLGRRLLSEIETYLAFFAAAGA